MDPSRKMGKVSVEFGKAMKLNKPFNPAPIKMGKDIRNE
jgi:hypothetical protein